MHAGFLISLDDKFLECNWKGRKVGIATLKPANGIYLDPDTRLEILVGEPICNGNAMEMSDEKLIEMVEATIKGQYKQ